MERQRRKMRTDSTMAMKMTSNDCDGSGGGSDDDDDDDCWMLNERATRVDSFSFLFHAHQLPPTTKLRQDVLRRYTHRLCTCLCVYLANPLFDHHHPFLSTIVWRRERERKRARDTYNIHIYAYKLQIGYKNKKKNVIKLPSLITFILLFLKFRGNRNAPL